MDEMIRALLSEPPPAAEATNDARRRLTEEIAARRSARSPRKAWRWSLAGTAVAAAVAVVIAAGNLGATAPEVAPPGPEATAPELLLAAAHQAAAKPAGSGRYWRVQIVTKASGQNLRGRAGGETFDIGTRRVEEVWQPKNPNDGTWAGEQGLGWFPWSARDKAAWERAGSPTEFEGFLDPQTRPRNQNPTLSTKPRAGRLERVEPGYRIEVFNLYDPFELTKLPADPDALQAAALDKLKKDGREPGDLGVYVMMTELLKFAPATPELRSAAFTVLSRTPGVRNVGIREDATGRQGIGIGYLDNGWIILNPRDYTFLGFGSEDPKSSGYTATSMLKAEWTDAEPVAPALS
jgi:hypothetical protein